MRDHLVTEGRAAGVEEYRWLAGRAGRELERRNELSSRHLRQQARCAAVAAAQTYLGADVDVDVTSLSRLVDEHLDQRDTAAASRAGKVSQSVVSPVSADDEPVTLTALT